MLPPSRLLHRQPQFRLYMQRGGVKQRQRSVVRPQQRRQFGARDDDRFGAGGTTFLHHRHAVLPRPSPDTPDRRAVDDDSPQFVALYRAPPLDGPRRLFWNFISPSPDRIEQAKQGWRAGRFAKAAGDKQESIPLPEERIRVRTAIGDPPPPAGNHCTL
jgi:hypothetical protein